MENFLKSCTKFSGSYLCRSDDCIIILNRQGKAVGIPEQNTRQLVSYRLGTSEIFNNSVHFMKEIFLQPLCYSALTYTLGAVPVYVSGTWHPYTYPQTQKEDNY